MRTTSYHVVLLLVLALFAYSSSAKVSHEIQVGLKTPWVGTNYLVEASEFIGQLSSAQYFSYVRAIAALEENRFEGLCSSDQAQYDFITKEFAPNHLSVREQTLLRLSLNIREYAPRVQLFRTLAITAYGSGNLPESTFCDAGGTVFEEADSMRTALQATDLHGNTSHIHDAFDHLAPVHHNGEDAPILVLYTDFCSGDYSGFIALLDDWISDGYMRYMIRPYVPVHPERRPARPTLLQGYGAMLDIKNMEYKVVDDQKVEDDKKEGGDGDNDAEDDSNKKTATSELSSVDGLDFKTLVTRHPQLADKLGSLHDHLRDQHGDEVKEVKTWQLRHLGMTAAERILASSDKLAAMADLAQNFPQHSSQLVRAPSPNSVVKRKWRETAGMYGAGREARLYINGHSFDAKDMNMYQLSAFLQAENRVRKQLHALWLPADHVNTAMTTFSARSAFKPRFDLRSPVIKWVNDLENDPQYKEWPSTVKALFEQQKNARPGQIKFIAKNLYNAIMVLDLTEFASLQVVHLMLTWLRQNMPVRFGIVLKAETVLQQQIARLFYHAEKRCDSLQSSLTFGYMIAAFAGQNQGVVNLELVEHAYNMFKKQGCKKVAKFAKVIETDMYDKVIADQNAYIANNFAPDAALPIITLNGVTYPMQGIQDYFMHYLSVEGSWMAGMVQRNIVSDDEPILDSIMESEEVFARNIPEVFVNEDADDNDKKGPQFVNTAPITISNIDAAGKHRSESLSFGKLVLSLPWFTKKKSSSKGTFFSFIVATDLSSVAGLQTALNAISIAAEDGIRVSILHNLLQGEPVVDEKTGEDLGLESVPVLPDNWELIPSALNSLIYALEDDTRAKYTTIITSFIEAVLKECTDNGTASACFNPRDKLSALAQEHDVTLPSEDSLTTTLLGRVGFQDFDVSNQVFKYIMGLSLGQTGIIAGARIIRLQPGATFSSKDFAVYYKYETARRFDDLKNLNDKLKYRPGPLNRPMWWRSDSLVRLASVLQRRLTSRSSIIVKDGKKKRTHGKITIKNSTPGLLVECVVDPLSTGAQKLAPILLYLRDNLNAVMRVVLTPKLEVTETPLKSYYRFVLSEEPTFDAVTGQVQPEVARFAHLPEKNTLTLKLDTPTNWLVTPSDAKYDMDNIRLESLGDSTPVLRATYCIDKLLVQGHAHLVSTGQPPQGLQILLSTAKRTNRGMRSRRVHDTVVMHNLGYYQLHANPGMYALSVDRGLKSTSFDLVDRDTQAVMPFIPVVVKDFIGDTLFLAVKSREGTDGSQDGTGESEDDNDDASNGLLTGVWNWMSRGDAGSGSAGNGGVAVKDDTPETINIFSLASGHLYERFLKVMTLSLVRQTKNPVKFWFLNNFLSPKFRQAIPRLAKKYGFDYELVTYQWPRWLREQTEKQRLIWGYKILFLDVLFPLKLKKVIVVDSDQIVRADMLELWQMDLKGKPLAYTPFCTGDNANEATKGFRFWEHGFWKDHLRGRPYHISALYVIDLERFRLLSAGDALRQMYQSLTSDPGSLANLDQDLPNYAQSAVPIFSLPEEWLWCETWCSSSAKKKAKTIDLCNNPLTKTPKLDNARVIVPEWVELDREIRAFEESEEHLHEGLPADLNHDREWEGVDDDISEDALGKSLQKDGTVRTDGLGLVPNDEL